MRNIWPRRSNELGFTAVDLIMTLALLGIVLSLGLTRMDSSAWRLDTAATQVAQRTRVARSLAVLRQENVIVTFDVAKRVIVLHEDTNGNGSVDAGERVMRYPLDGDVRFTRGAASAYQGFTGGAVTFSNSQVTFRRNGSASEEGAVYVGRGTDDAHPVVVVVNRATGYTETLKHTGSGWVEE